MMAAIAEDWHEELCAYPAWAIGKAVRWWISADNPDRRRKPLPGDIADRAKREAGVLKLATHSAERFKPSTQPRPASKPITEAQRAETQEILRGFGVQSGGAK